MGSQDTNMRLTGLCLAVLSFSFIEAQTSQQTSPPTSPPDGSSPGTSPGAEEGCCLKKVVSGTSNDMDGTCNYKKTSDGTKDENCFDGCIYTREGREGEEYCFKFVTSGAANINDECGAPTGTTPASGSSPPPSGSSPGSESPVPTGGETSPPPTGGETSPQPTGGETSPGSTVPTSAGSTLSPEDTISAANSVITQANAAHAVATENANTASEASAAVDEIQASLSASRIKRQSASTTVGPVTDCADFGSKYKQLLTELSSFSDSNVGLIKQLVTVLKGATNPCDKDGKDALKAQTESLVAAAKSKATEYKAAKEAEKEELVKKVQQALADIEKANTDLTNAGKPTAAVVTAAFSVTTTPPSTGETSPPPTGGETSPPPTGGETSPPPTGGDTSPPPTGGETSPGSTVPTSAGTTLSPEDTISAANSVITQANAAHAVAT